MTRLDPASVQLQVLTRLEHLGAAVDLQRAIWGSEYADVESRSLLVVASRFAGQVLGAFDGETLIGFALSFHTPAWGRLHSHRVGVHPEHQNRGVGRLLKLAQREHALAAGLHTIQWTFDPLQARNAFLNFARLGVVARTYLPDVYGRTTSHLHGGLPTDRLLVEWELNSPRVHSVLAGEAYRPADDSVRLALPPAAERKNPELQLRLRHDFEHMFSDGYAVTHFTSTTEEQFYTLERR
jgi:predicted GNAT superfamily acetyltransferase